MLKFKGQHHPDIQACICKEGFSIIQASISLFEWDMTFDEFTIEQLFELGLLKKLLITEDAQMKILPQFPARLKKIISSMMHNA